MADLNVVRPVSRVFRSLVLAAATALALWHGDAARAAVFNVSNLNDTGAGSLRSAVVSANATNGADVVTFSDSLTGTITLTSGSIDVTDSITITGPGSAQLTISGNHQSRIFYFSGQTQNTHTVSGLSVIDGQPFDWGGGILSWGDNLTLDDVVVSNCVAGGEGGGLYFRDGNLTVQDSAFAGNMAENATSCFEFGDVGGGRGGGIYAEEVGAATLTGVTFSNNGARGDGGGLAIVMKLAAPSAATISGCTFTGNTVNVLGCDPKSGGGIYVAGMANDDTLTIDDSTISGNTANAGNAGGLLLGDLADVTIRRSTIAGNNAAGGDGGGLFVHAATTALFENVTISSNTASARGGAMMLDGATPATVRNTTITGNTGGTTGGLHALGGSTVAVRNSIVANSIVSAVPADDLANDGSSSYTVAYSNIETAGAATISDGGGNLLGVDPQLGALQNNGGPTFTHGAAAASPVVDAGDPAFVAPPATDQRGEPRVVNGVLDMGSVEYAPPPEAGTLSLSSATYSVAENGATVVITVNRTGGSTGAVSVDYTTGGGSAAATSDYTPASGTLNWASGDSAAKTFNVAIVNDGTYEGNETVNIALSNVVGAALGTTSAVLTITEDETFPALSIGDASQTESNSGTSTMHFTVTLSPPSTSSVTVNFATSNGTAAAPADYTAAGGMLTFAAGVTSQNIGITIVGDATSEFNETFNVTLSSPVNATIADAVGVGTILSDDVPPAPSGVVATGATSTSVSVTWVAGPGSTSYQIERQAPGVPFTLIDTSATNSYTDTTAVANTAYRYRVRAINGFGTSVPSAADLATTVIYSDPALLGTTIKAAHLDELRRATNAIRILAGLAASPFTDSATSGLLVKSVHVTELRTALDAARAAFSLPTGGYTDSSPIGLPVRVVHFEELRSRSR